MCREWVDAEEGEQGVVCWAVGSALDALPAGESELVAGEKGDYSCLCTSSLVFLFLRVRRLFGCGFSMPEAAVTDAVDHSFLLLLRSLVAS